MTFWIIYIVAHLIGAPLFIHFDYKKELLAHYNEYRQRGYCNVCDDVSGKYQKHWPHFCNKRLPLSPADAAEQAKVTTRNDYSFWVAFAYWPIAFFGRIVLYSFRKTIDIYRNTNLSPDHKLAMIVTQDEKRVELDAIAKEEGWRIEEV